MAKIQNTYLNKEGLGSFLSNLKKIFLGTKTITSAVDWNTLTENGVYHIKTTAGTNRPVTNWGMLYVEGEKEQQVHCQKIIDKREHWLHIRIYPNDIIV